MQEQHAAIAAWLETPLGRVLCAAEHDVAESALGQIFGFNLIQVGAWGATDGFLAHARTTRSALIGRAAGPGVSALSEAVHLGIASGTIDAVLLPHTLELEPEPHQVLREAERVLAGEGHLIVLGFNPYGFWGVRRAFSRGRFPAGLRRFIPEGRIRDWLALLGFEVERVERYCFRLPINGARVQDRMDTLERWGARCWPLLGAGYMVVARKRIYTLTPVRLARQKKPVVAGGLVEPTARSGLFLRRRHARRGREIAARGRAWR